ncbi:N-acetylglucosamine kinase [Streptomyces fradiae]|uniref:N-acetylglucosamine kinase n=1 Tax=Streptomyces fradiae TaxID=1906 RepID=UPI002018CA00|nr:BadF/BadG/BcrA/BcrD ATPase family protein [Streptomyces fradiae]
MSPPPGGTWVLGADSGGSGLRVALAELGGATGTAGSGAACGSGAAPGCATGAGAGPDGWAGPDGGAGAGTGAGAGAPVVVRAVGTRVFGTPVPTGAKGVDACRMAERLVGAARDLLAGAGATGRPLAAVAVGAAGMAGLGGELRAVLPGALRAALGVRRLALASDAVTAHAGALTGAPGTVVAAGTGLVALGTDLVRWRRADGWGHLLGDCGGGAWIGRAGLEAALRAHDGRRGGSGALLARAEALFGPVAGLPGLLYPRPDRAAVLASFAPEVAACADGDPVAADVLARAARHIAEAAAAVHPEVSGGALALTGGLLRLGDPLLVPLREELARQLPGVRRVSAAGDPLSGALHVAATLAAGAPGLPREPGLLDTYGD